MKIPLPDTYFEWLEKTKGAYCVKHAERLWFISTAEELEEELIINKQAIPSWQQLKAFTPLYRKLNQSNATLDQDENEFLLDRLDACIAIGDDNGDPLFCDPSDSHSIWCYYHDGGDVQLISNSLEAFIAEAEICCD